MIPEAPRMALGGLPGASGALGGGGAGQKTYILQGSFEQPSVWLSTTAKPKVIDVRGDVVVEDFCHPETSRSCHLGAAAMSWLDVSKARQLLWIGVIRFQYGFNKVFIKVLIGY